jgi:hypothetical protein
MNNKYRIMASVRSVNSRGSILSRVSCAEDLKANAATYQPGGV